MGFTPLDGVPMGTRTGSMDPAVVTYLINQKGMSAKDVDALMNKESGVSGVSGVSSDFRDLSAAAKEGNDRAQLALDMFSYQVKKDIGAYAAAMGGVDAVVFTAGVGEMMRLQDQQLLRGLTLWVSRLTRTRTLQGVQLIFQLTMQQLKLLLSLQTKNL